MVRKKRSSSRDFFRGNNLTVLIIVIVVLLLVALVAFSDRESLTGNAVTGLAFRGFGGGSESDFRASCKENDLKCSSNNVVACKSGRWRIRERCELGCIGSGVMTQCIRRGLPEELAGENVVEENICRGIGLIKVNEDIGMSILAKRIAYYFETDENAADRLREWNDFEYLGHSDGALDTRYDLVYGEVDLRKAGRSLNERGVDTVAPDSVDVSGFEENTRGAQGIVILDPEAHSRVDRHELIVPADLNSFLVNIAIKTGDGPRRRADVSLPIGKSVNDVEDGFGSTVDADDMDGFIDTTINVRINLRDEDFDIRDEVSFRSPRIAGEEGWIKPHTGLTWRGGEEDFAERVFVPLLRHSWGYYLVFEDQLPEGLRLSDASERESIVVPFLGRQLEVVGTRDMGTELVVNTQPIFFMNAGDSVVVSGREITLVECGAFRCTLTVDGMRVEFNEGESRVINGLRISVEDVVSERGIEFDSATVRVGERRVQSFRSGDSYFGEDVDDPMWEWDLADLDSGAPVIGIRWALDVDEVEEIDNPLIEHPLYEGESVCLPSGYACLEFVSLTNMNYYDYELVGGVTYDLYASQEDADRNRPSVVSERVIEVKAKGRNDDGLNIGNGAHRMDTIALAVNLNTGDLDVYRRGNGNKMIWVDKVEKGNSLIGSIYLESPDMDYAVPVSIDWMCEGGDVGQDIDILAKQKAYKERKELEKESKKKIWF